MPKDEQVLVVSRSVFERVGVFHGLSFDVDRYLSAFFAPGVSQFMPRAAAEENPAFKQIIPYVVLGFGDSVLSYVRGKRAGETRLVDRRSIGIGGHINPVDDEMPILEDRLATYRLAVQREVEEEVEVRAEYSDRMVAVLNDDTTDVGRVHIGIVHYWSLAAPDVLKREQMMTQLAFLSVDELRRVRDTLETWSQFCLDRIEELRHGRPARSP